MGTTDPSFAGGGGLTDPSFAAGGSQVPGVPGGSLDPSDPRGSGSGVPPVPMPGGGFGAGGTGAGLPGRSGKPKEVTIKDGDRTIGVSEPDARGRSMITIDDGSGEPKTYQVDFGDGPSAMPDAGQLGGDLGAELVRAGEDGKAIIHDGDTTITAERVPGAPDQMKLTIDDGTPPPSEYTVDFNSERADATPPAGLGSLPTPDSMSRAGGIDLPGAGGGLGDGGGSGSFGGSGGGGGVGGGGIPGGDAGGAGQQPAFGGATGAQSPGGEHVPAAAVAGGGGPSGGPGQGVPAGGVGAMPMGMGMGAGAGQGGDQTREASKWRTQGKLFDDADPAESFSGIVGEDPANRTSRAPKGG
jgi:hypothetical protein